MAGRTSSMGLNATSPPNASHHQPVMRRYGGPSFGHRLVKTGGRRAALIKSRMRDRGALDRGQVGEDAV